MLQNFFDIFVKILGAVVCAVKFQVRKMCKCIQCLATFVDRHIFDIMDIYHFDLIKKVYEYTHEKYPEDSYIFYATTNVALLNDEMKEWFREHKSSFVLGLSLDGLPDIHNHNRSKT